MKSSANPCTECEDQVETQKEMNTNKIISNNKFLRITGQLYWLN